MANVTRARNEKEVVKLTSEVKVQVMTAPFDLIDITPAKWDRLEILPSEDKKERMNMLKQKVKDTVL